MTFKLYSNYSNGQPCVLSKARDQIQSAIVPKFKVEYCLSLFLTAILFLLKSCPHYLYVYL